MWLHLLFNTIFPFIILVAMNMSIYRKLVSVSHNAKYRYMNRKFFSQSRYHIEESGDRKRKDSGEES